MHCLVLVSHFTGYTTVGLILMKILITAARKTITRSWYKSDTPKQQQWLDVIQEIRTMERLTCVLGLRVDLYAKRWQKWIL